MHVRAQKAHVVIALTGASGRAGGQNPPISVLSCQNGGDNYLIIVIMIVTGCIPGPAGLRYKQELARAPCPLVMRRHFVGAMIREAKMQRKAQLA